MKNQKSENLLKTILLAGLLVGFLDGLAAVVLTLVSSGKPPIIVFQYIASGIFGKSAFSGGLWMGFLGVGFHFLIAFAFTVLFFLVYPRLKFLEKNFVLSGVLYGIFIWFIMNLLVLPLSHIPQSSFNPIQAIIGMVTLVLMVGLPLSWIAHRYYLKPE